MFNGFRIYNSVILIIDNSILEVWNSMKYTEIEGHDDPAPTIREVELLDRWHCIAAENMLRDVECRA